MQVRVFAPTGAIAVIALAIGAPASAGIVDIGGGWEAIWDDSLDPFVNVVSTGLTGDAVFIEKHAEFTQGSVNGVFPSIPIVFRQIALDAVPYIVIDSEVVTNSTGEDWSGFVFNLFDHGQVTFDVDRTLNSGGPGPIGWDISPFTTGVFENSDMRLALSGGIVANGDVWTPGAGPDGGDLWIDARPGGPDNFQIFTFKETPIPGPGVVGLLAIAGLAGARRRRR